MNNWIQSRSLKHENGKLPPRSLSLEYHFRTVFFNISKTFGKVWDEALILNLGKIGKLLYSFTNGSATLIRIVCKRSRTIETTAGLLYKSPVERTRSIKAVIAIHFEKVKTSVHRLFKQLLEYHRQYQDNQLESTRGHLEFF